MALLAMCMPILPGKKDMWKNMIDQVKQDPNAAAREEAGVHERTFLQETPHGDFIILTFEGRRPPRRLCQKSWAICPLSLLHSQRKSMAWMRAHPATDAHIGIR